MSRSAKLTSIDAVDRLSAALAKFGEEAAVALEQLDIESKRALAWIGHDRKTYWAAQVRRNRDGVSEARAELERALTFRDVADQRPSCREERAALEKARRRLRISEEKIEAVRHWTHVIDHEVLELVAGKSQLSQWLQSELPKAQATLKRLAATLDAYVATPTAKTIDPATARTVSTKRLTPADLNKGHKIKNKDNDAKNDNGGETQT